MEEKFFFNQGGVSVSNARFMVHGQTYAMNGVTSVKQSARHPSRLPPIVVGIAGVLLLFGGSSGVMWGLIALGIAALWWFSQKSEWIVVLNSASGEAQALTSKDRLYIDSVIDALNQSIIYRG